jgi:hypothetical protein
LYSLNRPGSRANHSSSYSSNRLSGSAHSNTLLPDFTTYPFPSLAVCLDLYSSNRPDSRVHACSSSYSLNRSSSRPLNPQFPFHEPRFPSTSLWRTVLACIRRIASTVAVSTAVRVSIHRITRSAVVHLHQHFPGHPRDPLYFRTRIPKHYSNHFVNKPRLVFKGLANLTEWYKLQ